MARKKKNDATATDAAQTTNPTPATTTIETNAAPQPKQPAPAPKKGRKKKDAPADAATNANATLQDCFEGYLRAIEEGGSSVGTAFSYKMELQLAGQELGLETRLADLTPERVQAYYTCDRVMKTRSGKPKAQPTFLKSQRVLRLALVWAENAKLVAKAPLPETLATH